MIIGLATMGHIRLARIQVDTTRTTVGQLNRNDRQLILILLVQLMAIIV
jgi:hypothetical protein